MSNLMSKESTLLEGREVVVLTIDEYKQFVTMVNQAQDSIAHAEEQIMQWQGKSQLAAEQVYKLRVALSRATGGGGGDYVPGPMPTPPMPPEFSNPQPFPAPPVQAPLSLEQRLAQEDLSNKRGTGKSIRKDLEAGRPAVPVLDPNEIQRMREIIQQYDTEGETE